MPPPPRISFVIPAYNEERLLGPCLESVLAELKRTPCAAEIVVVDNASTDATRRVARHYPGVRVVAEPRKGLVRARRTGFEATTAPIVANIDADTRLPCGWLATVLREFSRDSRLVALSGPYLYDGFSPLARAAVKVFYSFGYAGHLFNHHVLRGGAMLQGGNFVLRRDAWERAGGFDARISFYGEDTDVARRISRFGRVKWTWRLPMHTSSRRLLHEGIVRTGSVYAVNFLWVTLFGRPYTKRYTDVRPKGPSGAS
ncbi:MAG: glycosyltransferase family 2 protein [Elusimicrobia bacterium]|nr:glycosyltransferase family 2 protein [Elusimicrobiota bacterium]